MTIQSIVADYVMERPSLRDCIKLGVINYSKLARLVSKENSISISKNFDALLIACRRMQEKLKGSSAYQTGIISVLRKSRVEAKNRIIVAVFEKGIYFDDILELSKKANRQRVIFNIIESTNAVTVITSSELEGDIRKNFSERIVKITGDHVLITLRSPKEIEGTPGVISYLFSIFSARGINIVETMSCWTDTLFVIDEKDAGAVMGLLKF